MVLEKPQEESRGYSEELKVTPAQTEISAVDTRLRNRSCMKGQDSNCHERWYNLVV